MERLHVLAASALVLLVALACKQKKTDDESPTASSAPAVDTAEAPSTSASAMVSATASPSASAVPTPAPTVKLENCGQRYAAPARVDGKCADYCGGDYKCGPDETCTPTSWEPKTGARNTKVCVPKGVNVRAPIPGAPWDTDGPAQETASTTPSVAPGDKNGEVGDDKGKCPAGWVMAEDACHRPCTKDSDCNPPKSFCKKWEGKKLCAFTGSLVIPND